MAASVPTLEQQEKELQAYMEQLEREAAVLEEQWGG